jgi:hypothetical protein
MPVNRRHGCLRSHALQKSGQCTRLLTKWQQSCILTRSEFKLQLAIWDIVQLAIWDIDSLKAELKTSPQCNHNH